jgi:non-heme chloroperoxidase
MTRKTEFTNWNRIMPESVPREVHQALRTIHLDGLDAVWASIPRLLVSCGDKDLHTRFEMSNRILDLSPAARMSIFEGTGHAPFYERPVRFNRELEASAKGRLSSAVSRE